MVKKWIMIVVLGGALLFPFSARADSCSSFSVIVQAMAVDRDNGIPMEQELMSIDYSLAMANSLTEKTKKGAEDMIRMVYSSKLSPSQISSMYLQYCESHSK